MRAFSPPSTAIRAKSSSRSGSTSADAGRERRCGGGPGRANPPHPAPRLYLQLHRPPDHRRARAADQKRARPLRQAIGADGGDRLALFYSGLAIPIAWLADRRSRVNIIAASIGLWSLFTAACGFAQNFWQLFLAGMGVGIGEAGGVAPSYALISDFYPIEKRGRALAFFSLGIPIGSALGIFFGGWIASHLDWRSAFMIVGLAGLPSALLVRWFIPEPRRGGFDEAGGAASAPAPPFLEV